MSGAGRPTAPRRPSRPVPPHAFAGTRIVIGGVAGAVLAVAAGLLGSWLLAPSVFWIVGAGTWIVLTVLGVARMDASSTARWATREDPTVGTSHLILILASLASLGGVVLLLVFTRQVGQLTASLLGIGSVAASWVMVHLVYTLGYAASYYSGPDGGIDFNQKAPPSYGDFAYFGFTVGMTYQVSDTTITDPGIRRQALRHALLSYFLGAVVLAIAINFVAGLTP